MVILNTERILESMSQCTDNISELFYFSHEDFLTIRRKEGRGREGTKKALNVSNQ